MANLRFAVLGTGFWSHFQIPAWFEVGGVDLVACYNRTVSKAEAVARKFDIPRVYGDPEEMLQKEELDFIDIITEIPAHEPLVLLAAKYKMPVICQKPMAASYESAERMVNACKDAGIPYFVHENFRWTTPIRTLKNIYDTGVIGKAYRARFSFVFYLPLVFENQPFLKELEHFAFTDVGSHLFDLTRFFFGDAQSIYAQQYRTRPDIKGEDVASAMVRCGDTIVSCDISYSSRTPWEHFPETLVFIEGTKGSLQLAPDFFIHQTTDEGTLTRRFPPPVYPWADPAYAVAHASIVDCNRDLLNGLKGEGGGETTGEDNLKVMELVYSAYKSLETGQAVKLA
jgi:predicted dehydrogenase